MSTVEQDRNQMASDVAGAAGDEDSMAQGLGLKGLRGLRA
jgi:hypothetical protein